MRTIREVLRLGLSGSLSLRDIGRSLRITHPTVQKYIQAAQEAGLDWRKIAAMDDESLREIICAKPARDMQKPLPDYSVVHQELKKAGVTLELLWQEYKEAHPAGYQMTQFRRYYYDFVKKLKVSIRQRYKFGESMFVDYAGQTVPIHDRITKAIIDAQIFVAVLGASNYTYAEATPDQRLASWIGSHVRAFEYFQGVPLKTICDNLKAGVTSACRYEPDINPTYNDMAAHYGTVVLPTRIGKPKDKAKVEAGVLIVERWILAALRHGKFFSLGELNEAIRGLLVKLNQKPFKKLPGCRESVYKEHERPALQSLPEQAYQFAQWKKARVNIDYHIELDGHYYSVPYTLVHETVEVRYTARTVEIFRCGRRITSHARNSLRGRHTTIREHMPKSHQEYLDWTPTRMIEQAKKIGPKTGELVEHILVSRQFPQQGYRSCLGILRLAREYSPARLEAACQRALAIGGHSYKSVHAILKAGLDRQPLQAKPLQPTIHHDNIRGQGYFNNPYHN
jgi:transposase